MKKSKIMVVDDSKMILGIATDIIRNNIEDCEVVGCAEPQKAMAQLLESDYHVLLLDIIMPEVTGIEMLKWIKDQPSLSYLKVIMFTSLNDSEALKESFEIGAYDFVTKPLEYNEFVARLNHALLEYKQGETIRDNLRQLEMMNKDLLALNKSLKETRAELVQKDRLASVGFLAAGMAHEINNPLGFLSSNLLTMGSNMQSLISMHEEIRQALPVDMTKDALTALVVDKAETYDYDFIKEDHEELMGDIKYGMARIKSIVESLRRFSEANAYGDREPEPLALKAVVEDILTMNQGRIDEGIEVKSDIQVDGEVYVSRKDFNMSLLALITNAIDAVLARNTLHGGQIWINASEVSDTIIIIISDNGVGMNEETHKHMYDPFFTTKDVGEGVGLGLTTAYNYFVNGLKGTLEIVSKEGLGTEAIVTFKRER